jgi:CRP/FNR family cyclic AMP-dependent transcriptional regulator
VTTEPASTGNEGLRATPLLARLPDADIRALARMGQIRSFRAGEVIFREGDPGDALYSIVEGRVRITMLSPVGSEATLALLGPGECVGDMALLDGGPRSATATATTASRALVVTRNHFIEWLSERPAAALALLETVSLRLRRTNEALADLAFLDVATRLAKRLVSLSSEQRATRLKSGRPSEVRLKITQAELASMLGVSRESVNKQLNAMARQGYVTLGRGSITIRDADGLNAAS